MSNTLILTTKECKDCPLANDGLCQKVYKVRITTDLRKYTAPAKRRTAVERVDAYLKGYFQLNNVRYRTGKRAKVYFDLSFSCIKVSCRSYQSHGKSTTSCLKFKILMQNQNLQVFISLKI